MRAAKAALGLAEHEECDLCLKKVAEIDPNNAALRHERERLNLAMRKYRAQERQIAKNIGNKLFAVGSKGAPSKSAGGAEGNQSEKQPVSSPEQVRPPSDKTTQDVDSRSLLLIGTSILVIVISVAVGAFLSSRQ